MSYYNYGYAPYVSVASKIAKAQRWVKKQKGAVDPIPCDVPLGTTWWGKAWNINLKRYADCDNRVARGKSYLTNGFVVDMHIEVGVVHALVMGSSASPYRVVVRIDPITDAHWKQMLDRCGRRINDVESLIRGDFPKSLQDILEEELFPTSREIHFSCSCPDGASMCKHVSAVLYGVGVFLDRDPSLFFKLRDIDMHDLIKRSVEDRTAALLSNARKKSNRELDEQEAQKLFGL